MNALLLLSLSEIFNYILYVLLAVLILLLMITVHELGHYIAGKIFGFGIEEFAIGFGPKIFSKKKKNGEIFSIRLLPLGGFCSFKGEDEEIEDETAFNNKKPWQRIIVLASGAIMNYLLALVLIATMFGVYGHTALMAYKTIDTPEAIKEYTFQDRDVLVNVEGKNIYLVTDLMDAINGRRKGEDISATVFRKNTFQNIIIKLQADTDFSNMEDIEKLCASLGLQFEKNDDGEIINTGIRTTGIKLGFFQTIVRTFEYSFKLAGTVFTVLGQLITGALGLNSVGGTVTTITVTAQAIKTGGMWSLLNIAGLIGVNLAVFNLLPIPALDGSRIIFTIIEWIRKKPLNRKVEGIIHTVGLVLLFLFAIIVDLNQCLK